MSWQVNTGGWQLCTDGTIAKLIAAIIDKMPGASNGIQVGRSLQQLGSCVMCVCASLAPCCLAQLTQHTDY